MNDDLQRKGTLTVAISLTVNVFLAGLKLIVGFTCFSQALVADGIHSLVDIAGDIAALIGLRLAHLPKDEDHPYGHHRFSTLAALLISSLVLLFCLGLAWQSLSGLVSGAEVKQPGLAAAWVAGAALLIKEVFYQFARRQAERLGS
ncbi:MAG: cation diffusion facilitator family transporter, partial [Verrucomicrobia bacterium]|nr:cation diffusion facilitator family transporter [Verrucomicrobiota bacterium]